jgi:hypothetical protein
VGSFRIDPMKDEVCFKKFFCRLLTMEPNSPSCRGVRIDKLLND